MQRFILPIWCLLFLIFSHKCYSQFHRQLDSLCILCDKSTTDSEKVNALGNLANHYYIFKLYDKGDSVLHQQLLVAEVSNNHNLILQALFGDAILNIGQASSTESFDKTIAFAQRGIDYARTTNQYDYLALGYIRMANILRKREQTERALTNCIQAVSLLQNISSDSVKALVYLELGETYMSKGEAEVACVNYNNAYDIAVKMQSVFLQSKVHHSLSEMYNSLDDSENAKIELGNSLELNRKAGNIPGVMMDYIDLARVTDQNYYIEKSIQLSDSLKNFKNLLISKRLRLVYSYVIEKNAPKALRYLKDDSDLNQSFLNEGEPSYLYTIGNIYFYSGNIDSALYYYKKAEPQFLHSLDRNFQRINFEQIAECQKLKNNYPVAINYYHKALDISLQMNDATSIAKYSGKLSELYESQNDFKNAFHFFHQEVVYKDSLNKLSSQNQITLRKVERERTKYAEELLRQQEKENNRRNIQYMGITVAIVILFFVMLFIGSFPVSRLTVKLMGYFFFISLFEFISLMIDKFFVSPVVHNQPLRLWLIKIAIIAVLVPFQQFLEHRVMAFLISKKLIEARTKFSIKKWWADINKKAAGTDNLNKDQAVM